MAVIFLSEEEPIIFCNSLAYGYWNYIFNVLKLKDMEIVLIVLLFMIAIWNAYVILWKTERNRIKAKKYSKIWHGIGLFVRVIIYALPFLYYQDIIWAIKWTLVFISIGGIMYDFTINAIRYIYNGKPDIFYVDNKGWNSFFLKFLSPAWYWILRGLFVVVTIIFFIQ